MTQIEWSEEFSVGNAAVDQEHESLIEHINELYEQLNQPLDTELIESMLADIQDEISMHFALEELLMQEAGFAEYDAHKQDHERLLDQIHDIIFHFTEDPGSGRELLINRLSCWLSHHFKGFDVRLHDQLG